MSIRAVVRTQHVWTAGEKSFPAQLGPRKTALVYLGERERRKDAAKKSRWVSLSLFLPGGRTCPECRAGLSSKRKEEEEEEEEEEGKSPSHENRPPPPPSSPASFSDPFRSRAQKGPPPKAPFIDDMRNSILRDGCSADLSWSKGRQQKAGMGPHERKPQRDAQKCCS